MIAQIEDTGEAYCCIRRLSPAAILLLDAGHADASESAPRTLAEQVAESRQVIREHMTFATLDEAIEANRAQSPRWSPLIELSWRTAYAPADGVVRPTLAAETFAAAAFGFSALATGIILLRHSANLRRLLDGEEPRVALAGRSRLTQAW